MINICSIRDIKKYTADETWIIVRSLKTPIKGCRQVQDLSPSYNLFCKYQNLKKEGKWGIETFKSVYMPRFLKELKQNKEAKKELNYLYFMDKQGKNITLACFCPDEQLCHRSIIAGLLSAVGCDVNTETGKSYKEYWDMYTMQT